jgi:hypothetical protein
MIVGVVFVILFTVFLEEYFVDGFAPNHILRNGFPLNFG